MQWLGPALAPRGPLTSLPPTEGPAMDVARQAGVATSWPASAVSRARLLRLGHCGSSAAAPRPRAASVAASPPWLGSGSSAGSLPPWSGGIPVGCPPTRSSRTRCAERRDGRTFRAFRGGRRGRRREQADELEARDRPPASTAVTRRERVGELPTWPAVDLQDVHYGMGAALLEGAPGGASTPVSASGGLTAVV
jgi:hypothetical protein